MATASLMTRSPSLAPLIVTFVQVWSLAAGILKSISELTPVLVMTAPVPTAKDVVAVMVIAPADATVAPAPMVRVGTEETVSAPPDEKTEDAAKVTSPVDEARVKDAIVCPQTKDPEWVIEA